MMAELPVMAAINLVIAIAKLAILRVRQDINDRVNLTCMALAVENEMQLEKRRSRSLPLKVRLAHISGTGIFPS
ncbi:hypothetical protein [Dendronalium sp. ChiSLP03b]|uniref:hypothetical protein n=1 Tax=Dendronalium sp. ChiSLP03b TaxID=3075381 RepID=UPI002AD32B19|nr:hypothetical protein [Dendronalium sp. ChiSLP03b]MDZ8202774.1 hypothetical protein [Dendronalium sp. ChiSLP03b]